MKIGQFSDSFVPIVDGVGRVVYYYCETIAKTGNEVSAIVPLTEMGYRGKYPFEIIDFYSLDMTRLPYKIGMPITDEHFRTHLAMTDFDIVHLHSPFIAGAEAIRYAEKHDIPLVGTFHSKFYDDILQTTNSELIASLGTDGIMKTFFNKCDEVWAVSEATADTLRSYGYKKDILVMPNGMELRTVDPSLKDRAKEHFQLNDDPLLLFVGQQNWKKNIRCILEACSLLRKDGVRFQLALAGQGPHEKEIAKAIDDLDLREVTTVCGHITDVELLDGLYDLASIFVFPSLYDNAPMVVREAANAGTPSICVRGSTSADIIEENVNGLLCEDDPEDLFKVIRNNLSDPEKLQMIGENARQTIPVSWDVIIQDVLKRYEELIELHKKKIFY